MLLNLSDEIGIQVVTAPELSSTSIAFLLFALLSRSFVKKVFILACLRLLTKVASLAFASQE